MGSALRGHWLPVQKLGRGGSTVIVKLRPPRRRNEAAHTNAFKYMDTTLYGRCEADGAHRPRPKYKELMKYMK